MADVYSGTRYTRDGIITSDLDLFWTNSNFSINEVSIQRHSLYVSWSNEMDGGRCIRWFAPITLGYVTFHNFSRRPWAKKNNACDIYFNTLPGPCSMKSTDSRWSLQRILRKFQYIYMNHNTRRSNPTFDQKLVYRRI